MSHELKLIAVSGAVGFAVGGMCVGFSMTSENNQLPISVRNATNDFYEVATSNKMVRPEELLEACVDGVNKRSRVAVRTWLREASSPKSPADGP